MIDLLPYCLTDRQREVVTLCAESGSQRGASKRLGVHNRVVERISAGSTPRNRAFTS